MAMYRVRYVLDTDTCLIHLDIRIGKVSIKYLFLNKKIISDMSRYSYLKISLKSLFLNKKINSDTRPILPDTHIGKVSIKYLFLNKKIISDIIRVS
jgi:hypothetical protein